MNAAHNIFAVDIAACRNALGQAPLLWKGGAWRYGRRKFTERVVRSVIAAGDGERIGNFIVRSVAELGQPHMVADASFETMSKAAQELLDRAVRSEVTLKTIPVEAYELVIAGFGLIVGFTIKPNEAGFSKIAGNAWHSLSSVQQAYLAALRAGKSAPIRSDGLAGLHRNVMVREDAKAACGHSLTPFAVRLLDRYWKG